MNRLVCLALLCLAGAVPAHAATPAPHRWVRIYEAYVFQGEYGTVIDDPACPLGGFRVEIDPGLDGSAFMKVLRGAGGRLGPAMKHVIVDGLLRTDGPLGSDPVPTLVRVYRMREKVIEAASLLGPERNPGCEKDRAKQRQFLQRLQRKRQRRR
jgi:hypothetical protein